MYALILLCCVGGHAHDSNEQPPKTDVDIIWEQIYRIRSDIRNLQKKTERPAGLYYEVSELKERVKELEHKVVSLTEITEVQEEYLVGAEEKIKELNNSETRLVIGFCVTILLVILILAFIALLVYWMG